jgi:uncharacterized protein (TIGR02449 family)
MADKNLNELDYLEMKVDYLLREHKRIVNENASLRERLHQLTEERQHLQEKNLQAVTRIKHIIEQIRKEPNE